MNNRHHHSEDDPYSLSRPPQMKPTKRSLPYQVYTQELPSEGGTADDDPNSSTVVEPSNMNTFMDHYLSGPSTSNPQASQMARQKADEDLAILMEETADMGDIQKEIEVERSEMAAKYREDATRQRRAAAARARYQRMTENERKAYNQRRRLKSTTGMEDINSADGGQMHHVNAKKAEAARQRYHKMTAEQKKDYNLRRTEAFRRRRMQEEALLATPAGQISSEALAKAQQIMVRNARKAQSARMRYQRMTPDERKAYNLRRAASKKKKIPEDDASYFSGIGGDHHEMDELEHDTDEDDGTMGMGDLRKPANLHFDANYLQMEMASDEHMSGVVDQVAARPPKDLDVFAQMELDVLRRTKKAKNTIMRQSKYTNNCFENPTFEDFYHAAEIPKNRRQKHPPMVTSTSETFEIPNLDFLHNPPNQHHMDSEIGHDPMQNGQNGLIPEPDEGQRVIDEQALHRMVETGYDATGMPVEVRTADGEKITNVQDLLSRNVFHGQTVLITSRIEQKPSTFDPIPMASTSSSQAVCQDNQVGSTTSSHLDPHYGVPQNQHHHSSMDEEYGYEDQEVQQYPDGGRQEALRARRAERARARYHRMSEEQRREQNAKRAAVLRQARLRDERFLKIAETTPLEELDEETVKGIQEAQERRQRRAEQARNKYRRMSEQERKIYNSTRDAVRKSKKDIDYSHLVYTQVPSQPPTAGPSSSQDDEEDTTTSPIDPDDASSFFYGVFPPKN